jgi:membrane-associated phospholipid phosphatase
MDAEASAAAGQHQAAPVSLSLRLHLGTSLHSPCPRPIRSRLRPSRPSLGRRLALLAINGVAFQLLYGACSVAAARAGVTRAIATPWDAAVPFVPWMLVPYMSSVPTLVLAFLLAPDRQSLRALSERGLLATALATLVFALWPLRMTTIDPLPASSLPALLARLLGMLDQPFNQWPSLHVAYCVVAWPALRDAVRPPAGRAAIAAWLALVVASTVLAHRHFLPDVAGGLALGALCRAVVPARRATPAVGLHYLVATLAALVLGLTLLPLWLGAWLAAGFARVALAYASEDVDFLRKRRGTFPAWVTVLMAPYLVGYRLTWHLVRWRERGCAPVVEFGDGLWIGRRLAGDEVALLPPGCAVIDLAAELSSTPSLRAHATSFGLLDIVPPAPQRLAAILDAIDARRAAGQPVFVHCAMGYRRSREVALAWRARHATSSAP